MAIIGSIKIYQQIFQVLPKYAYLQDEVQFSGDYQFHNFRQRDLLRLSLKVTVHFERCFRLMEHISVISCRNPINLYITEKLIQFLFGNFK